ncbi:MAG: D-alanyl-D-alanine carboxypeptidase family protein [Eubacteriales bacterium]
MRRFCVCLLLLCGWICRPLLAAASPALSVSAEHAALYEPENGIFLYEKDAATRAPMASTTKIMTAVVVVENMPLYEEFVIPPEACGIEGSSIYLQPGEVLTIEQLLYAMMLNSANDAAAALAIATAGSIEAFAEMMNECAGHMGLQNTHFTNPHGLDHPEHYTTARDLAVIGAHALASDPLATIVATQKKTVPLGNGKGCRVLYNHNKLLRLYDDAVGIKTGFTRKSGRCLVGAARRDGVTLVSVTLNAGDDWNDHIRMFEAGFASVHRRLLAAEGELSYRVPVINGKQSSVVCTNNEDVYAILPSDKGQVDMTVHINRFVPAPIKKGEVLGTVYFSYQGRVIASASLVASEGVEEIRYKKPFFRKD